MIDTQNPYSYKNWLAIQKIGITEDPQKAYMDYLKNWYLNKTKNFLKPKDQIKQEYLQLIKDLSYLFNQQEKDRFLKDIDYNNPEELIFAIPYFSKKLKEIAKVLNAKRNSVKKAKLKHNLTGSNDGLETLLYEYVLRSFTKTENFITQVPASPLEAFFPELSSVKDNFFIEIEELYDTNNYLDSDPSVPVTDYVNVDDILNAYPFEDLTEDEIVGLLNTRFLPKVAETPLNQVYQAYLDFVSLNETAVNSSEQLQATDLINYQLAASEKYMGETVYGLTAIKLKDLNLPDQILNLNFTEGNNWFVWPSGSKAIDSSIGDNYLRPIPINESTFIASSATGKDSYENSDLIFTDKNGVVEGAWLRGIRSISSPATASLKLNPLEVKDFIFPYVGFNLSTKGTNWLGHAINDNSSGIYDLLDDSKKKEILKKYFTETIPNSSSSPFYINQSTLIKDGAKAGEFTYDSDVLIRRTNSNSEINLVYNDETFGNSEASFLYKFQRTNLPITLGLNQIYWPIQSFDSVNNIPLTILQDNNIPVNLANLNVTEVMLGAIAGLDFNTSDVIYKLNSRTSSPVEAAWLGSTSIQNLDTSVNSYQIYNEPAIKCAKYIDGPIQPSLSIYIGNSEAVSFVWNDIDTPANDVFKFFEHAPNCPYGKESYNYYDDQDYQNRTPLKDLNHWKKCNCKSVYYSPIGHEGNVSTDYNSMTDMLFADPDGLQTQFNFDNWSDTRGLNYLNSPQFSFYKLTKGDSKVGWGNGYWKTGIEQPMILKTGRRYTYIRSSLRKDSTSDSTDGIISPYYIVKYSYKQLKGICSTDPLNDGCYDLIIALDISNSQKLTVEQSKELAIEISKALLNEKNPNIQIGLLVFNRETSLISYLTKSYGSLEFNLKSFTISDDPLDYKTNITNALILAKSLLEEKIPPDSSEINLRGLCNNLNIIVASENNKAKIFNVPQNCGKKILLISDGQSNIQSNLVISQAQELKKEGIEIYGVDIGLLSSNNNIIERVVSGSGYYFNLQKFLNEGDGNVFSLSQKIAAVMNQCTSVVPSWNKAIRNGSSSWVGLTEPSDMVLRPGDYLIYVHRDSVTYIGEDSDSSFITNGISFTLNIKLNGWDYNTNTFSLRNIGDSYGAKPYWAVSVTVPDDNFKKETNHFGGNARFIYEYVPIRQPDVSPMIINSGDFLQYFRRKNTSFEWQQPITLTSTLSDYRWNKLVFEKDYFNLNEILKNGKYNFYGFGSDEPSDLVLESYSEFKLSRYNYYARNPLTYVQDLYNVNRCDNTFVVFNTAAIITPMEPYVNLLNMHYPTLATFFVPKNLVSEKQYGGYLTPIHLGVSYYRGKGYEMEVDKNQITFFDELSAEKTFFSTQKYGGRNRGLTKKDQITPVTIKSIDNRWLVESFNAGERRGMLINTRENQKFTPYQTTYEILNKNHYGLSRQNDKIEFWTDTYPALWNDENNYPLTYRKELMASVYDLRKKGLLVNKGEMAQWRTDIYGNEYGLFKGSPTPFIIPESPIVGENSTYFGFCAGTGASTNQHWIQYARWSSELDVVEFSQILNNSTFLGDAVILNDGIKLTRALTGKTGIVNYNKPVFIKNNLGQLIDWSVYFISSMGGGTRADGFGFFLQSNNTNQGGGGFGMGYQGILNSVGILYDTYQNAPYDPNNNHIEIDVNGDATTSIAVQDNVGFDMCGSTGINKYVYNWIDYSSVDKKIYVYISLNQNKPSVPRLTKVVDIEQYLILI